MKIGTWGKITGAFILMFTLASFAGCAKGGKVGGTSDGDALRYRYTAIENVGGTLYETSYTSNGIARGRAGNFTIGITDESLAEPYEIIGMSLETGSGKIIGNRSAKEDSVVAIGLTTAPDGYLMIKYRYDNSVIALTADFLSRDGAVLSSTELESSDFTYVLAYNGDVLTDADGYIHIANMVIQKKNADGYARFYEIFSPEGKLVKEISLDATTQAKLCLTPEGKVCADLKTVKNVNDGKSYHKVMEIDALTGKESVIVEYETGGNPEEEEIFAINVFDENRLVYLTEKGIYLSNRSLGKPTKVFGWFENGLSRPFENAIGPKNMICSDTDGNIYLYLAGSEDYFLKLEPSLEEVFLLQIASRGSGGGVLETAVRRFNLEHPDCRIVLKDNYDKMQLTTELVAGEGPVILEGFSLEMDKLEGVFEPLENLVSKETIAALNKGGRVCGTLDGTLYGACSQFTINTLISASDISDWDYDTFIETAENSPNLKLITGSTMLSGKTHVTATLFAEDYENSYFINPAAKDQIIDTAKLKRVIDFMDKYQTDEEYDTEVFDMIANGTMLAVRFPIYSPIDYYSYYYAFGNKGRIVGFPGKSGSKHFLSPVGVYYVRKNSTDKEKEYASEFLECLLSYDVQSVACGARSFTGLSAREDVLNEQIEDAKEHEGGMAIYGGVRIQYDNVDTDVIKAAFDKIMEESVPVKFVADSFDEIVYEELDEYYAGKIDFDTLADRLNKRIGLIVGEKE